MNPPQVLVWPSSSSSGPKRKSRPILSCARCRLYRVKCDRTQPCSNCKLAGREGKCRYHKANNDKSPSSRTESSTKDDPAARPGGTSDIFAYVNGKARLSTSTTGWAQLVCEVINQSKWSWMICADLPQFEEAEDYVFGVAPDFKPTFQRSQALKSVFPEVSGISPLIPSSGVVSDSSDLSRLLPDRQVAQLLLGSYLETLERLFPMWEPGVDLLSEFELLRNCSGSPSYSSYQQMFLMLALGCCSRIPGKRRGSGERRHLSKLP